MDVGIFSIFLILLFVLIGIMFLPQLLFMLELWSVYREEESQNE